ncbi:hypothetical protein MASR1M36_12300 [Candidatus Cloacimonadaceae bacterium]
MDVPDTEVTISKQVWTYVPDNQEWCRMPDMIQAVYASAPGSINYAGEYWNLVVMGGSGEAGISDFCQIMDGRVQLTTIAAPAIQIESNGQMIHLLWSPVSGTSSYKV